MPLGGEGPTAHCIQGQQVAFDPCQLAGRADAVFRSGEGRNRATGGSRST
jgi:hypothetical protein